ncbi:MAG: trigger factor [Anaerolineae bacterium]|nr:trigger factor [Anaerolineae bacterium]MBT7070993.1 trigger factor [Anaerolineae bacterium]MBT7325159.1 trigger factor [Anaerolineae bacterium]
MKIETTPREDHQVTLTVEIENDVMEGAKRRSARQIAKRGKIAGFRPGKAPYDVIRRQYGDEAILEGAIDILLDEVYPKALEESKLEPAAAGSLEKMESLDPPVFTFLIPLKPEVDLGDYRKIRKAYKWKKPKKKEVDVKLEELQRMHATTVTVERPVEESDYVMTAVKGQKQDAADGDEPVWDRESHAVFIAPEERENEEPFTGFGKQLIGLSPDETKSISHTFADDVEDEALRGATVNFEVTIKTIRGTEFPELNDEFAKSVGAGETLAELREVLEKNLEQESRSEYDDEYFSEVIEKIKAKASIKYPPQVLDRETEYVLSDIKQRLAQQGMEFETYLKMQSTDLEKFTEEEARPVAQKRLERGLIFDEIARLEDIEVEEKDLESEFNRTLMDLAAQGYDLNNVKGGERAQREIANNIAMQSATQIVTRRTLDRLKEIATGELAKAEKAVEEADKAEAPEGAEEPKKKTTKAPAKKKAAKATKEEKPKKAPAKKKAAKATEKEKPVKKKTTKKAAPKKDAKAVEETEEK